MMATTEPPQLGSRSGSRPAVSAGVNPHRMCGAGGVAGGQLGTHRLAAHPDCRDHRTDRPTHRPDGPADCPAELNGELGVNLSYHPEGRVWVEMLSRGVNVRVGGPIPMLTTRPAPLARAYSVTV